MGLVEISHVQGHTPVTIFHLQDRVNLGNFAELEELAKEAYSYGVRDLVIDLSKTPSMTSIGIRALITSAKAVKERGGKMVLVVDDASTVMMSIKATGVDQFVPVFADSSDAERAAVA